MKPNIWLVLAIMLAGAFSPETVRAQWVHYMDCNNSCHKPTAKLDSLNGTICLTCHNVANANGGTTITMKDGSSPSITTGFAPNDASNAMLTNPPAVAETSHHWAASKDVVAAAGAKAPANRLFYGRYGISSGKVTCSRCHDPHGDKATNPKLLKLGAGTESTMCLDCHSPWNKGSADHGLLSHPIVADYAAVASGNPKYNLPMVATGGMQLVAGGVSCLSCHGVHYTDSDSTTTDDKDIHNDPFFVDGDGKMLRADGPDRTHADEATRAQLRSNLCQACHKYGRHGIGRTHPIGCLDCHSGHSYDPAATTQPNYYVLRPLKNSSSVYLPKTSALNVGSLTLTYKTLTTDWGNNVGGGTGYCQKCHTLTFPHNGVAAPGGGKAVCGTCHVHNATAGSFAANCNSCHGYPPSQNVAGGSPNSGYAAGYNSAPNTKDESQTAHARHAATSQYKMSCDRCHADVINNGQHNNGNFQNVNFDAFSGTGLAPAYNAAGNAGNGQCSNIYCHSNGGARTGDATRSYVAATIPAWQGGDIANCTSCHGNSAGTMGNNSATHIKHLNKGYGCKVCHLGTAVNSTTLVPAAIGGIHVNGSREVSFDTDYDLGATPLGGGGTYNSGFGTCSTSYCHSNGRGTTSTPDWDTASSGACGTCHKLDVASGNAMTSGSHTAHINDSDSEIGRNVGCAECHSNTVSNNSTISNQSNHVNGAINLGIAADANKTTCSNISCHSNGNYDGALVYKAAGVDFVWGGPALAACDDCHGDGAGKAYPTYANAGSGHINANSHSAHIVGAGAACGDCHSETSTAGATINGTAPTKHVNKDIDVKGTKINGGAAGSFNSVTKTCSSVTCHGGNSPVWGATLTCGDCHLRSAGDADDFTYNNGTLAMLDTEEWLYSGHGKSSGSNYDVTARPGANFTGTDPCLYCHDDTVSHGAANYFRLRMNGKPDLNGACLGCHATASTGVDPDGAGTDFANKNSTVKIDKYHGGAKHNGTDRDAGRWCWDCHDPHGDADTAGLRIQMIQRRLAVDPDANGKPASLTGTDIIFTDRTVGAGAGGFARNAPPYEAGVCNACHTMTAQYKTTLGANGHPTTQCTSCHSHSGGTGYDGLAFKASCNGCHGHTNGQYWPYGSGGAILAANNEAGRHQKHVEVLASRLYSQSVAQLLVDAATDTKQKAICAYCHATPGNDGDHGLEASLPADKTFHPIWNVSAADAGSSYAAGNCSGIDCHNNKATGTTTYGWNNAGTTACIMCHIDVPNVGAHSAHMDTSGFSVYYTLNRIGCPDCHSNTLSTAWSSSTPPSSNHINGTLNVSGTRGLTYTPGVGCGTNSCHNNGKNGAPNDATYAWGDTNASCTFCHFTNAQAHQAHFDADINGFRSDISCLACHLNYQTSPTHFDGDVSMVAAMTYSGNTSVASGSADFGYCNTLVCHQNARGTAVVTPLWNATSVVGSCELCHANVPATGTHAKHVVTAPTSYGEVANNSTLAAYNFSCGNCHPKDKAGHMDSTTWTAGNVKVDVTLNSTHGGVGSLKSKNNIANDTGGYSQTRGTSVTCSAAYCHSALNAANSRVFGTTPNWYGGSFAGDPCAGCHGNSPAGGAHQAHEVGFHYDSIYSGTTGFLPVNSTAQTGHGNANSTVISCHICHNDTVTVKYNDKNAKCDNCHGGSAPLKGNAAIASKQKHVNGANDVVFVRAKLRSKGQVRDTLSDVPELGNNWTRVNGYKAADGSSYDETPNTLYNSATWTSADKSCTVACHLWEAGRVDKVAPKWDSGAIMCIDCHSRLPK